MSDVDNKLYSQFAKNLLNGISKIYWSKMLSYIKEYKIKPDEITGFLVNPEEIIISMGRYHIAIEYYGRERLDEISESFHLSVKVNDYSKDKECNLFEKVIGIHFASTVDISFPLQEINEGLIIPTNEGADKLIELGWNFVAQDGIIGFNTGNYYVPKGQFTQLINCIFFDANESGLITRRVKWIDFIPLIMDETSNEDVDEFRFSLSYYANNWLNDLQYTFPLPKEFKNEKLIQVNKFIEIFGSKEYSEPEITSFLSRPENKFILCMGFFGTNIFSQLHCEWQSQEKEAIIPDFFVIKPNGFADIIEFKLPYLKNDTVVGSTNRETFSSELNKYISQTRVYREYFDDPNSRKWVEEKYGFKVYKPKRILVIGRRFDFDSNQWLEIKSDYTDLEIYTYDDLVDGVFSQFYM